MISFNYYIFGRHEEQEDFKEESGNHNDDADLVRWKAISGESPQEGP